MAANDKEVVLGSYEAVNRGDIEAAVSALAVDAEWHESGALPEPDVYIGREAIGRSGTSSPSGRASIRRSWRRGRRTTASLSSST